LVIFPRNEAAFAAFDLCKRSEPIVLQFEDVFRRVEWLDPADKFNRRDARQGHKRPLYRRSKMTGGKRDYNGSMSLRVYVDCYSGYRAGERPISFELDDQDYPIAEVLDRWYEPASRYFKVRTAEGKTYVLRHDESADEWTLKSGFDGAELLARPNTEIVSVDEETIRQAEREIASCGGCDPEAEIPFDWILGEAMGQRGGPREYVLSRPAVCPRCRRPVAA